MPLDTHERIAIPCDCAGTCTILVFEEIDLEGPQVWVEHYKAHPRLRWRGRLKVLWTVLRGREADIEDMVLRDEELRRLRGWIDERLAARRGGRHPA